MAQKIKTYRNRAYLDWVKTLPCCHCGAPADDPHHIKGLMLGTVKAPDFAVMPLCRGCHNEVHRWLHSSPDEYPQARWVIETLNQAFAEGIFE